MDDEDLRARLSRTDPAADLTPLDVPETSRLLEETMNDPQATTSGPIRSRLPLLVGAATVIALLGIGSVALFGGDDPTPPTATDPVRTPAAPADESSTDPVPEETDETDELVLEAPATVSARCAVPSAELLANAEVAFDGTVRDIDETAVVLIPTRFYSGPASEEVRVESPLAALSELIGAVEFQVGERYLVSAVDGQVTVCGFSGPYSPDLEQLYVDAFGG